MPLPDFDSLPEGDTTLRQVTMLGAISGPANGAAEMQCDVIFAVRATMQNGGVGDFTGETQTFRLGVGSLPAFKIGHIYRGRDFVADKPRGWRKAEHETVLSGYMTKAFPLGATVTVPAEVHDAGFRPGTPLYPIGDAGALAHVYRLDTKSGNSEPRHSTFLPAHELIRYLWGRTTDCYKRTFDGQIGSHPKQPLFHQASSGFEDEDLSVLRIETNRELTKAEVWSLRRLFLDATARNRYRSIFATWQSRQGHGPVSVHPHPMFMLPGGMIWDFEYAALKRLKDALADCEGAAERASKLQADREQAYLRIFESIVSEEQVLRDLYRPLMDRLAKASGTLRKLSFSVSRHADVDRWAMEGEGLFDKRRTGPFKGVGTLKNWADTLLRPAWESGDPAAVAAAMAGFRQAHQAELLDLSEVPRTQQADYRSWLRRFAKWLYGTSHIEIRYSIDFESVDIRKLSPGTRGIVLLLLYLALDDADDRPLIIDQPEENLDPKSIFDELVELFIAAKNTRQVIMVTHNANLVVNTDADQVIVAFAGTHTPGSLPPIRYLSGGLESANMRKHVCDILEGGERAFKERARRLRVRLDR